MKRPPLHIGNEILDRDFPIKVIGKFLYSITNCGCPGCRSLTSKEDYYAEYNWQEITRWVTLS